jgi:ABC-type nitrate/sulfonate/bicarbonate transport system substrate-binding protein
MRASRRGLVRARRPTRLWSLVVITLAVAVLAACTSATPSIGTVARTTPGGGSVADTTPPGMTVIPGSPFPTQRCAANKAAGTITFLTGFDFAAAASMVDVFVAHAAGYYAALCLDVRIKASFSADNYPLIAADNAQFASGGSFGELVEYAGRNEAQFKALSVEGRTDIDTLIVKPGAISSLADLRGKTIGVSTAIIPGVQAMLLQAGLVEHKDYNAVQMVGFDPKVHIATPDIVGFDGYTSNEPLQLQAAGIKFDSYNPADYGIPGSFGVIYTNATFISAHPTAAEDFMRATMRGLHDAIADPDAASAEAIKLLNANGNPLALSPDNEIARWQAESKLIAAAATPSFPLGVPDPVLLEKEIDSYGQVGVFGGITPDYSQTMDGTLVKSLYDTSGTIIWPAKA